MFNFKGLFKVVQQVIGLDIAPGSIKLVEILDTPQGPYLNKYFQRTLPRGVIVNGEIIQQDELTAEIKKIIETSKSGKKGVVTSLSGHSVMMKKINFNVMTDEELRELLADEGSKYLPFDDMSQVYLDFQILKGSDVNPNQMEVLLVAAKKDTVNNLTGAIVKAGLPVVIVDVDSFALETMYEESYDYEEDDVDALINIGASITNINVVKGGMSIFTRDFILGGDSITETIAGKLGMSFDEAEQAKLGNSERGLAVKEELVAFSEPIIVEIERSLDYFKSQSRDYIKRIILSGGTARIPGLAQELEGRLGIPTEIVNPFRKMGYNKKTLDADILEKIAPQAAVGIGLALRRVGDK